MRWEYFGPDPSLVVSDGEKTWIFDSANKEVQVLPGKGGGLSGGVLDFLLSGSDLKKEFLDKKKADFEILNAKRE